MNWKIALALCALVTSVAALAACGGGDDCSRAQDHLTECMSSLSGSSSSSSGMAPACSFTLCQSQCINNATCSEINSNLPSFTNCVTGCQGK
jgi:hypothetical protein